MAQSFSACTFGFSSSGYDKETILTCAWRVCVPETEMPSSFCTVDILFQAPASATTQQIREDFILNYASPSSRMHLLSQPNGKPQRRIPDSNCRVTEFLFNVVRNLYKSGVPDEVAAVKLVLPTKEGSIVRSDYLETRLAFSAHIDSVVSFLAPRQTVEVATSYLSPEILYSACFGIKVKGSEYTTVIEHMDNIENELLRRISPEWIINGLISSRTVALLEGPPKKETAKTILDSARSLGIELVILDSPGHWMSMPENSHYCAAFVPIDMTKDAQLGNRAADALKQAGLAEVVEAVISCRDSCLAPAATAMDILGLSTSHAPPSAYKTATDKYLTRKLNQDDGVSVCFKFSSCEELERELNAFGPDPDIFPLVVKPCHGGGSEGVSKVHTLEELYECVQHWLEMEKVSYRHGTEMMAESYVEGPEVDANFILFNGELLFFELVDDYPCEADDDDAPASASFVEGSMVYPSKIPKKEAELIKASIHQSLLKMGFRTGFFHCEARVHNSSMTYTTETMLTEFGKMNITDLVEAPKPKSEPRVFLIEVNARPCGLQALVTARHVYGIDYYDIFFLSALQDRERIFALSQPFQDAPFYWCDLVYITSPQGGTFASDDPCNELLNRCPELKENVAYYWALRKRGDAVPHPSQKRDTLQPWIASLLVFSRRSRLDMLALGQKVRAEFRYELV